MDNAEAANLKELKTVAERTIQSQSATIDQICRQLE
jgi:hypothetical protein